MNSTGKIEQRKRNDKDHTEKKMLMPGSKPDFFGKSNFRAKGPPRQNRYVIIANKHKKHGFLNQLQNYSEQP